MNKQKYHFKVLKQEINVLFYESISVDLENVAV